jgi:dUTP pyrophosphatase
MMTIQVQLLTETAKMPTYAHIGDAGMDLYVAEECTLAVGERAQIKTGIALAIPHGYVGLIWDKSGLSHKTGLKVLGGVIDAGYRGEVLVGMVNVGRDPHTFTIGDKVAQMLIQKVEQSVLVEVKVLDETTRGIGGFGSTGVS